MTSRKDFGAATEAAEVLATFPEAVEGKVILITGVGPNGLGAALARALASGKPALLILAGRARAKVEAIRDELAASHPTVATRVLIFDISSLTSVAAAAKEVSAYCERGIDILINNAGAGGVAERQLSADGFEIQLATNYLGLAYFTDGILRKILAAPTGRIVNVMSNGHALSPFRFSDYNFEGKTLPPDEQPSKQVCEEFGVPWGLGYLGHVAYGQSKTAGLLYTRELADRLRDRNVAVLSVHPGAIRTDLWRHLPSELVEQTLTAMNAKSHAQGAAPILVAALDPKLADHSGAYLSDCQIDEVSPFASDKATATRLWAFTEQITGQKLTA